MGKVYALLWNYYINKNHIGFVSGVHKDGIAMYHTGIIWQRGIFGREHFSEPVFGLILFLSIFRFALSVPPNPHTIINGGIDY